MLAAVDCLQSKKSVYEHCREQGFRCSALPVGKNDWNEHFECLATKAEAYCQLLEAVANNPSMVSQPNSFWEQSLQWLGFR